MSGGRRISEFERLTRPGGKPLPDDDTIPVLTERLSLPSLEIDTSLPESPLADVPPRAAPPAPAEPSADTPAHADDVEPSGIADRVPAEPEPARDVADSAESTLFPVGDAPDPEAVPAPGALQSESEVEEPPFVPALEQARSADLQAAPEEQALEAIDWTAVEEEACAALQQELQPRLAAELDRQLRERLQPTLVRMLLATVAELRPAIDAAVRDAISRAVAAEVARQKSGQ